jgi:hypothetical protein
LEPSEFKPIDSNLKPKNKAEEQSRARFLAHSVFARVKSYIKDALEQSAAEVNGTLSTELQDSPSARDEAAKKLAVACIHLAGLERGGVENPEWFLDFVFSALRETDRMAPQPTARSLIQLHGQWVRPEIISGVVDNSLRSLNLRDSKEVVARHLIKMVDEDKTYRTELVDFALTEPLKVLEEHQMLFDFTPL